jgi:hypothetical protein
MSQESSFGLLRVSERRYYTRLGSGAIHDGCVSITYPFLLFGSTRHHNNLTLYLLAVRKPTDYSTFRSIQLYIPTRSS